MTPLTLKCDNPSIECNGHSVQIVGTLKIETTADMAAEVGDLFSHALPWSEEPKKPMLPAKEAKRAARR